MRNGLDKRGMWLAAMLAMICSFLPVRSLVAAEGQTKQADQAKQTAKAPEASDIERNLGTLASLLKIIRSEEKELAKLHEQLKRTKDETEQNDIKAQIKALETQIEEMHANFGKVAAGVSEEDMDAQSKVSLQEKIERMLEPLFNEVEQATADSRLLAGLKEQKDEWAARKGLAESALARIDTLLAASPDPALAKQLKDVRQQWELHLAKAVSQIEVLDVQINDLEKSRRPVLEAISIASTRFWRSRGLNVILAVAIFLITLFGTRWIYNNIRDARRKKRPGRLSHLARVADLTAAILSVFFALLASLTLLYVKDDWVLLSLAAVFIVGLVWAARNTLGPMIDKLRLLLNLGPVREGERMIYEGLPWRLDKLAFFSEFSNPELEGGTLRLPVGVLADLHSRPCDPKEPWFPTSLGDWVVMGDETFGRVVHQSPEQVVILELGGARKTYSTPTFLENKPMNLSHGFRCRVAFGIDYGHQAIATSEIPEKLHDKVMEGLVSEVGHESIESVRVELKEAGDSSIDFHVRADFKGELASRYRRLHRSLARLCVEACNENGWVIPFPQLVVHQSTDTA